MPQDSWDYYKGALCGLAAASIWASWSALTRFAVTTSFDPWDVALLRYGLAGVLLFPVLARRGLARDRLGWLGLAVIVIGAGAPYALVAAAALRLAPAAELSALNPRLHSPVRCGDRMGVCTRECFGGAKGRTCAHRGRRRAPDRCERHGC